VTLTEVVATHEVVVEQGRIAASRATAASPSRRPFCVIWQLRDGRIYDVTSTRHLCAERSGWRRTSRTRRLSGSRRAQPKLAVL